MRASFFSGSALPPEKPGIKLLREQRILKPFDRPIENGNNHFQIEILAYFSTLHAEANKARPCRKDLQQAESD